MKWIKNDKVKAKWIKKWQCEGKLTENSIAPQGVSLCPNLGRHLIEDESIGNPLQEFQRHMTVAAVLKVGSQDSAQLLTEPEMTGSALDSAIRPGVSMEGAALNL